MSGGGTGQPLFFRCSQCRLRHGTNEYFERKRGERSPTRNLGRLNRVKLTGKAKPTGHNRGNGRSTNAQREYRCLDCGHTGWSCHIDLAKAALSKLKAT
jgi:predicted RNA-binding Zn-ribbon protein involved in translation (DUF1610 family)